MQGEVYRTLQIVWIPYRYIGMYEVEYEGSWESGIREGWGQRYLCTGEVYQGEFASNYRHGIGMMHFLNGDIYHG